MARQPTELGLSSEQLILIGAFAAHWSFLETEIEFTISGLGEWVDEDQSVPFPFDDKVKRWRKLANKLYTNHTIRDRCEDVVLAAISAHRNRSILLHGRLEGDKTRKSVYVEHHRHRRDGWNVQSYVISPRLLTRWVAALADVSAALIEFNAHHFPGTPASLPRKFGSRHRSSSPHQDKNVRVRKPQLPPSGG